MPFFPLPKHCHPDFTSPGVKPTGPVEIDWDNPLANGLLYAFVWQNGVPLDLLSGVQSVSTNSTSLKHDAQGAYLDHSGRLEFSSYSPFSNVGTGSVTMFSKFKQAGNLRETLVCSRVSTNNKHFELRTNADITGAENADDMSFTASGTTSQITAASNVITGEWQTVAGVKDDATLFLYVDGAQKSSASITNQDMSGSPTMVFGGLPGTATIDYHGDRSIDLAFDRALNSAEIASLSRDPYQILKPAVDVYAFWASAGGSTYTVTGSLNAILQKQGIAKQATLNAILQKQGLTLNSSVDALLQKSVDITGEIDAILQKLGITSISSIDALLQKSVTASASLDAILTAITSSTETASLDAILKKLGITSTASLDSVLQKQGLNVSASLSALLQKAVSLSSVIDAILQKTVTTSASLDAILTQAGSGSVSANFDAILRKTLSVNLSIDALLQKQDLTVYSSIDALLQKRQTATASLDAILYGTASIAASLDALLKRTGVSITANLDAILTASSSFITPKNLVYVMAEDRIVTVLAEDRIVKVI